ncbi:MAG: hypothetical protein AAFX05_10915 [Planctomycetota bacterium]
MARLRDRWKSLPRSARWLGIFGVILLLHFLVVEPLLDQTARANVQADRAATELAAFREQAGSLQAAANTINIGTTYFGEVAMPSSRTAATTAAQDRIDAVIRSYDVESWSVQLQRPTPLGQKVAPDLVDTDVDELQYIQFNLQISARADVIMDVISDLERSPELTTISQIRMQRSDEEQAMVQATILPVTWIVVPKEVQR